METPEDHKARLARESEEQRAAIRQARAASETAKKKALSEYRYVPQGHGAILPIVPEKGVPSAVGTDGMTPCIGVYFQVGDDECFVAHIDSETTNDSSKERWESIRKLATNTRDQFHASLLAHVALPTTAHLGTLRLVVNRGDFSSCALGWGVNEAFKKMRDHNYVFHDPKIDKNTPNLEALAALRVVDAVEGTGFVVDKAKNGNDSLVSWGFGGGWTKQGEYGVKGFTFTDK
ncbi:hypothetical protein BDY19DRAFT_992682 [Irpex rosettiformis]|uniref:Uncharacterized protein n=1 Tax=Irpex rosettiformis TaxID=378272 RepID=A0ACB8U5P2_9APHY|nr:hypothetical protein BDY19DRAFT_992682 [Irpex rosettiformis]